MTSIDNMAIRGYVDVVVVVVVYDDDGQWLWCPCLQGMERKRKEEAPNLKCVNGSVYDKAESSISET